MMRKRSRSAALEPRPPGDELGRYSERHFITRPELTDALASQRKPEGHSQQHFSRNCLEAPRPAAAT